MRVVVQRVSAAAVGAQGHITGQIGLGLLVLAGFEAADQVVDLEWMIDSLGHRVTTP